MSSTEDRTPRSVVAKVVRETASAFGITRTELLNLRGYRGASAMPYRSAIYLLHVVHQIGYPELGRIFNHTRKTIWYMVNKIEDRRDCPEIDKKLNRIERILAA